jgi:hypothetical protein
MLPSIGGASPHAMPSLVITTTKNGTINPQESNRRRIKRLMRRMVSSEFSAPTKATMNGYEMSPGYRRVE